MRRFNRWTAVGILPAMSLTFVPVDAAKGEAHPPHPGDRFVVEQKIVTEGTSSASGEASVSFSQQVELDLTATALESQNRQASLSIEFAYRRALVEIRMATDSATLELFPNRMILDGTPLYDSEAFSDGAPPVLAHLLNETFRLEIDEKGNIHNFVQRRGHRREDAFLDLAEPIRSLWIEIPPGDRKRGDAWSKSEPLRTLGDLLLLPASAEYTVQSVPEQTDPCLVLNRRLAVTNEGPLSLPPRIGYAVPGSLRSDSLGPDFFALPPSARFERLVVDSTETIHYRPDWGFLQLKNGVETVSLDCSLPRIQGPRRYDRRYDLRRTWRVEARPDDSRLTDPDVRYLLFHEEGE